MATTGDIVSNLMSLENAALIDTRAKTTLHDVVTESVNARSRLGSVGSIRGRRLSSIHSGHNRNLRQTSSAAKNVSRRASLGF